MIRVKRSSNNSNRFSSDESNSSSHASSSQPSNNTTKNNTNTKRGRVGNLLYIQLPNSKTCRLPFEDDLKISDLIERICMTEALDSLDYFVMLMVDDNNRHGLLDYTIPKESALLDMFRYSSIKLCPKLIYEVVLTNPADYEHGAFGT